MEFLPFGQNGVSSLWHLAFGFPKVIKSNTYNPRWPLLFCVRFITILMTKLD